MTAYFRITSNPYPLGAEAGDGEPAALTYAPDRLSTGFGRLWITGERFAEPPPASLQARIEPGEGGRLLDFYQMPICAMSLALHSFFREACVDNVDVYPLEIVDVGAGTSRSDYVAFNIVGSVAAADMARSRYENFDGLVIFDSISLDPRRAAGARMFRMSESLTQIIVDESVKALADARGLTALRFHPVEVAQ